MSEQIYTALPDFCACRFYTGHKILFCRSSYLNMWQNLRSPRRQSYICKRYKGCSTLGFYLQVPFFPFLFSVQTTKLQINGQKWKKNLGKFLKCSKLKENICSAQQSEYFPASLQHLSTSTSYCATWLFSSSKPADAHQAANTWAVPWCPDYWHIFVYLNMWLYTTTKSVYEFYGFVCLSSSCWFCICLYISGNWS